jgi:uncharacterized membrane protein
MTELGPHMSAASADGSEKSSAGNSSIARVIDRNIEALLARRKRLETKRSRQERLTDVIIRFSGSMPFLYAHAVIFGVWVAINMDWTPLKPFDPSLADLAVLASVEALFLSAFVLIAQNRLAVAEDQRADLDVQISLLTEHEVTRLVTLVTAIAENLGIEEAQDPELRELKRDVHPDAVIDRIEKEEARSGKRPVTHED